MVSSVFDRAVREATGFTWEEWITRLEQTIDPAWSEDQTKSHICKTFHVSDEWGTWLAVLYGQRLGRTPVGVTKDAGVQIGVRKTMAANIGEIWNFLLSPEGKSLWIGTVADFQLQEGFEFATPEGIAGKLSVVRPFKKLRLTWKRPDWERPSRLQITLLPANSGKTTVAFHQEMLEDVYIRELMRQFWEDVLLRIQSAMEKAS